LWWDFRKLSRPVLGPTHPLVQWVPVYTVGKAAGAWSWTADPNQTSKLNCRAIPLPALWTSMASSRVNFVLFLLRRLFGVFFPARSLAQRYELTKTNNRN